MLKSFTSSKRPLTHGPITHQIQNHKCYFHHSYQISKFCINKKCTLPLCEKCIPIHTKQHLKEENILGKQNIIHFSSAYDIAIQNLQTLVNTKTKNTSQIKQQLSSTKKQIEDLIQKQLSKIEEYVLKGENEVKVITQKLNKIQKGSLKTLIFYFSDEETLKSKTQFVPFEENRLSQIPLLIQNLKNALGKFSDRPEQKYIPIGHNPIRSDSMSKIENYPLKNYSSSCLGSSNNYFIQPVTNSLQIKQKSEQKIGVKLQSSSDFSLLLKQQRSRMQSVRNKNLSFATNYGSQNESNGYSKPGSKSVDNFYFTRNIKQQDENKEQKENRPLQMALKNYANISQKGLSPNKKDLNSNSQQKLSIIKQKYIGDMNLIKQNIKTDSQNITKGDNLTLSKYSNKNTPIHGLRATQSKQTKSKDLDNKILSRQQIRVNIQNRLNHRSSSLIFDKQKQILYNSKPNPTAYQGKQLFSDTQIKHQTLKQPFPKQRVEQFTLNKNYHSKDSYRQLIPEVDKVPMSSIKRQLRVEPFQHSQNQPVIKKFFDQNSHKLGSFDVRDQKFSKTNDMFKIKHEITSFIMDKKNNQHEQGRKAKIIHKQNLNSRNQLSKKDLLYDEAKQSIKLNDPNSRNQQVKKSRHQMIRSENQTRQNSESKKRKEAGRRFNYLYDVDQNTSNLDTSNN